MLARANLVRYRSAFSKTDRHLYEQLGMRGWRIQEPNNLDIPVEKPRALRKMAEVLYGTPINYRQLASDVHLRPQFMQQLIEAHADRSELPPKPEPEPTSIPSNVVSFTPNGNNDTAGV